MLKTITRISQIGEWENEHGKLYGQWIEFEGGYKGLANSKSPVPPYEEGEEVEIMETGKKTSKGYPKIRVKKADGDGPPPKRPTSAPQVTPQVRKEKSVAEIIDGVTLKTQAWLLARKLCHQAVGVPMLVDKPSSTEIDHFAATCAYGMVMDGWKPGQEEEHDEIPF